MSDHTDGCCSIHERGSWRDWQIVIPDERTLSGVPTGPASIPHNVNCIEYARLEVRLGDYEQKFK